MPLAQSAHSVRFVRKRAVRYSARARPDGPAVGSGAGDLRRSAEGARWRARIARHLDTLDELALLFESVADS